MKNKNYVKLDKCGKEFEDLYLISDNGDVYSIRAKKILKKIDNGYGYCYVYLKNNEYRKKMYLHRLVALHFIDNPENLPFVNHRDFNPRNNNVDNLEWCSPLYNSQYSAKAGHFKKDDKWKQRIIDGKKKKGVIAIKDDKKLHFISVNDTKKYGFQPACVCECCKGIRKKHKGFIWRYE